jgi:chromatin remodeling complex protein RSC6
MVRATKTSTPAPVATPAPVETKARGRKAKTEVAASSTVAPAPVVAASSTVAPVAAAADVSNVAARITEFNAKLQQLSSLFSSIKNDFKTLDKAVAREMKAAQKASSKKRKSTGTRKPSGFVKPTLISEELAAFLSKPVGTEMARTDVSKEINAYITANGLQDKTNGRKINADAKLTKLLKITPSDELTYFNLQRFMKHHFVKPAATA